MALHPITNCSELRTPGFGLALAFALALGACGEGDKGSESPSDGSASSPAVTAPNGQATTTDTAATDSAPGQPDGPGPGGSPTDGGATGTAPNGSSAPDGTGAGGASPGGGSGGGAAPGGGNPGGAGGSGGSGGINPGGGSGGTDPGGAAGAGDMGQGGASPGGAAGAPTTGGAAGADVDGGAGGSGGEPPSTGCTRDLLDNVLDDYFVALSAGDPSTLPLAANVKFTENAEETELGSTDFWQDAGDVAYSQRALDTEACTVAAQAVVPEGGVDLVIAVRIKLDGGEMTEIETIVFREGDYTASYSVPSNPQAIIDVADDIGWHDEIPEAARTSRDELAAWIDKYFRAFPNGVCNVSDSCRRLENGGGDFDCDGFSGCSAEDSGADGMIPRLIIVDEVRGIAAGFANFDYMADGHLDMHMIKMSSDGEVLAVQAILRDTDGQSGWD
jgi:hypothetical protein